MSKPELKKGVVEPNYKIGCMVCGAKPTVDVHPEDGALIIKTRMCGPCTWGEAGTADPANW